MLAVISIGEREIANVMTNLEDKQKKLKNKSTVRPCELNREKRKPMLYKHLMLQSSGSMRAHQSIIRHLDEPNEKISSTTDRPHILTHKN